MDIHLYIHNECSCSKILIEKVDKLMALVTVDSAKIDAANAAIDTLTTDSSTALADIKAEVDALKQNSTVVADPTASAALDSIASKITSLDSAIKGADPGPITPVTPGNPTP